MDVARLTGNLVAVDTVEETHRDGTSGCWHRWNNELLLEWTDHRKARTETTGGRRKVTALGQKMPCKQVKSARLEHLHGRNSRAEVIGKYDKQARHLWTTLCATEIAGRVGTVHTSRSLKEGIGQGKKIVEMSYKASVK
ncbi:hypothetical protein R1flu_019934 [Riccia fluitans]|uniref:Uncharacterized protein n=1 Tax=Riccia fluitans TaxID=41844 RepID=A0ABD1ZLP3_9MARC